MTARYSGPPTGLVVAWSAAGIAAALTVGAAVLPLGSPDPSRTPGTHLRRPEAVRTAPAAAAHPAPDKVKLIIQQNPMCWYPIPGFVCDPRKKTYL